MKNPFKTIRNIFVSVEKQSAKIFDRFESTIRDLDKINKECLAEVQLNQMEQQDLQKEIDVLHNRNGDLSKLMQRNQGLSDKIKDFIKP